MPEENKEKTPQEIIAELQQKCSGEINKVLEKYNMQLSVQNRIVLIPKTN